MREDGWAQEGMAIHVGPTRDADTGAPRGEAQLCWVRTPDVGGSFGFKIFLHDRIMGIITKYDSRKMDRLY